MGGEVVRPLAYIPVGWSSADPATRYIATYYPFLRGGWMADAWLDWLQRYATNNVAGVLLHNPGGCDNDVPDWTMRFNQFRLAADAGLDEIADKDEYRKLIRWCQSNGLEFISYVGSPHTMPVGAPKILTEAVLRENEHCLAYHGRIAFDAAYTEHVAPNDVTFALCEAYSWADKGSTPVIVEAIAPRAPETQARFLKYDQAIVYDLLMERHVKGIHGDQWPRVWESDFPIGTVYVLFQSQHLTWADLQAKWNELKRYSSPARFVPVVCFPILDRQIEAGLSVEL